MNRGFTLVELLISIGIFIAMTVLVVAKYGTFNQSTLLTDTAYDIALVMHLAQTYGLSVKNSGGGTVNFSVPYGVSFNDGVTPTSCGSVTTDATNIVLFADSDPIGSPDRICSASDANINSYTLTHGASIVSLCSGPDESHCNATPRLDVSYQRPNPEAIICGWSTGVALCDDLYAQVTIVGSDTSTRAVFMHQNGQVSVVR